MGANAWIPLLITSTIDPEVVTKINPIKEPRKGSTPYFPSICLYCEDATNYLPKMSFPSCDFHRAVRKWGRRIGIRKIEQETYRRAKV